MNQQSQQPEPQIPFTFNGTNLSAPQGTTVAAALLANHITHFRTSTTGQPRAPLCGMGICFECRLTINNIPHQKSCQIPLTPNMQISTND